VSDHGLDGGTAAQLALDGAEDTTLLAGDEDAARVLRVMTVNAGSNFPRCAEVKFPSRAAFR